MQMRSSVENESQNSMEESPVAAYTFLVDRAREFVAQRGHSAPEELLIGHVFGTTRNPHTWSPLFARVMEHATDLRKRGDGTWGFVEADVAGELLLQDFVSVDVETTGLKSAAHRVIEVGIARYSAGQLSESLSLLVNPGRRLPEYIAKLTGIRDDDLENAPSFAEIADQVFAFLGQQLIVGHNVSFDVRFLNAELKRAGVPQLINETIDTMSLAMRLLPHLRRPSLDKISKALGLAPRKIHRALGDAELTANCAMLLSKIAMEQGIDSIDALKRTTSASGLVPREHVGRARSILDKAHLADIPKCPGVYLMLDSGERVIYVGKAKNLRDRVSSYYAQPLGYTRKMDGLIESIARIDWEETGTELEALILEAQLIRRYQPRYNQALRAHEHYPYVRISTSSPWPRISVASAARNDGDRYFGPYRSSSIARKAVDLLNDLLGLRTCSRSFKTAKSHGAPCLRLDLRQCPGPCMGQADRGRYFAAVRTAITFLEGDETVLIEHLHAELEQCAEAAEFERARQLRNAISVLRSVALAGRALYPRNGDRRKVLILPSHDGIAVNVALVAGPRIWSVVRSSREEPPRSLATKLCRSFERLGDAGEPAVDQTTLDDTIVVSRWLERNAGHPAIIPLTDDAPVDWGMIAEQALDLTYETFVGWEAAQHIDELTGAEFSGDGQSAEPVLTVPAIHLAGAEPAGAAI